MIQKNLLHVPQIDPSMTEQSIVQVLQARGIKIDRAIEIAQNLKSWQRMESIEIS